MIQEIQKYLNAPENDRVFAKGVALLEQTNSATLVQLRALQSYAKRSYVNKQTQLTLVIALRRFLEKNKNSEKTPKTKPVEKTVIIEQEKGPLSIYAILETDPPEIKELIRNTGRMTDEAFDARNALFYLKTSKERYEYAQKGVQLYRKSAELWQKIKLYREKGILPPELMLTADEMKKEILTKFDRRKYLVERTYRLKSWLDGKSKPTPQYIEFGTLKKEWRDTWAKELEEKILELETLNEWLKNE